MPYTLPVWQDAPSTATPISSANLTQANTAINSIDSRLTTVETGKISTGLVNAQGNLISGDNTGTPIGVLLGANGQVLTVDRTTTGGLKWATPGTAVNWSIDPASANGVQRLRHSTQNFLPNSSFEYWTAGTSSPPDNWFISGGITVARSTVAATNGSYTAQITFGTTNDGVFYTDIGADPQVDYTYSCFVQRVSGTGTIRLVAQQDFGPFTEYVSVASASNGTLQEMMLTFKPTSSGLTRFSIHSFDATASVWVIDECMAQESKGVATTWQPSMVTDTFDQTIWSKKTFAGEVVVPTPVNPGNPVRNDDGRLGGTTKADLVSGKVPTGELGTGTASATTFLRGDQSWAVPGGGTGNVTWDIDPGSANGVTKLTNSLSNLLGNSGFEFWDWAPQNDGNPTIHEPSPYTISGSPTISRVASISQGTYSAQVSFITQTFDQFYQLYNVSTLDNNQWFTFVAVIKRVFGTGSIRMYLVQDAGPNTYYASLDPVVATGSVQTVMITGQCASGVMRVGFQQTTSAGSIWQFDSWGLYKSKGVAPGWSPAPIDDTSDQLVRGRKTFYPLAWTTVVPDGSDYVQLSPLGNAYYYCLLPNNTVGSNLRQQVVFALLDPDYNRVRQYDYSAAAKIYLVIEQNSIGGCFWGVSPSTIQWENGYGYSAGPYTTTPIDLSPNTITYCEFTFMGNRLGWIGKMFTGIPPQWSNTPASFSWTNTNGNGWPAGIGQTAVNTQSMGIPINFGRHVPAGIKKMIYNAFTQCCSASIRTRIANNNGTWEIGAEFNADGPTSRLGRGTSENFGGYSTGPGGLEGSNWPSLGLVNFSTFGYVNSAFNTNMAIAAIDYAVRGYVHEMCHAISSQYYGENNPAPPTGEPNLISQHSTMLSIKADCVANGDPANPPNAGDEWLAETEVYRRIGASGLLVDNATSSNSAILKQMGYKTNAGTGGTGGTPTQRYNRFVTYITSLIGNN